MEAHTPKREAIQKFVGHESGVLNHWRIRAVDEAHDPIVLLRAARIDAVEAPEKTLEVHTRQVRLEDGELDEATKTMIRRWIVSL